MTRIFGDHRDSQTHSKGVNPRHLFQGKQLGSFGGHSTPLEASGTVGAAPAGYGPVAGILQFRGEADDPQVITISVGASPSAGFAGGPVTGLLTWGSGNGDQQSAEFDIGTIGRKLQLNTAVNGGAIISVPCTHFELSARNDANLTPLFAGSTKLGTTTVPVNVTASAAVGSKVVGSRGITRTLWLVGTAAGAGLPATQSIACVVPPYATAFKVVRAPASNALTMDLFGAGQKYDGPLNLAANTICPDIAITPWIDQINITNTGATPIDQLALIFFLSL